MTALAIPLEGIAIFSTPLMNFILALGVGLLIGAERERRKLERQTPGVAGIRTFAIAAGAGAVGFALGGALLLAVVTALVGVLTALGYWRTRADGDPGLTTELALLITVLLGSLAIAEPAAAAGMSVALALLLAARERIHHFVGAVLTAEEVRAALVLAAAILVVLPLLPSEPIGPFDALRLRSVWRLVVLVLAIGAVGHIAVRTLGPRYGLAVAGLASGFVSSTATIGAMGARAAKNAGVLGGATAGAVLSTVATVIQLAAVVGVASPPALSAIAPFLISAGIVAAGYGAVFTVRGLRQTTEDAATSSKPFSLMAAILFAATLSAVLILSAALRAWFGETGAIAAAALAGFVDAHAAAISIAALVASGQLTPAEAVVPILAGFTTNTLSKVVVAWTTGSRAFAFRVIPGLLLVAAGGWIAAVFSWPR